MNERPVLGFDLGGTKMLCALLDSKENVIARVKKKTQSQEGADSILGRIVECTREALQIAELNPSDVRGMCIAVPGPVDRKKGVVQQTANLPFDGFPLKERLQSIIEFPLIMENDVSAGTFGEFKYGAARGYRHVVGIFPGSGIGGGLILNGSLYTGATGNAGEIGHMIISSDGPLCGCGQRGCLEAHSSKTAIAKEVITLASMGEAPTALRQAGTDFKNYTSKVLAKSSQGGDRRVAEVLSRAAWHLGIGMANCVNILSPEVIVLGGGLVEKLGKKFVDEAEHSMHLHAMPHLVMNIKVVEASLGDDAVILGAGALAVESLS